MNQLIAIMRRRYNVGVVQRLNDDELREVMQTLVEAMTYSFGIDE